ncbi:hypothetical protein GC176_06225 [bacterium]|nr:hypothetical protein [bacterium]
MNLAVTTTNIEHVSLDGPVSLSTAVVTGLLLLIVFAWSLWRERRILGRKRTIFFWLLRTVTLGTVIWLLLSPSQVRVETSTTRRAVAIVTDVSGSMQTIDGAGTSDEARWVVSLAGDAKYPVARSADRAIASAGVATRHVRRAEAAIRQHAPESDVVAETTAASLALQRVRLHLESIEGQTSASVRTRGLARRLIETSDGSEFQTFQRLAADLQKGRRPDEKGWRESLPDLELRLAGLSRSLHELARYAVEDESKRVAQQDSELLTGIRRQSRLAQVVSLVGKLDQTALSAVREQADVRLSTFVNSVEPVAGDSAAEETLRSFVRREDDEAQAAVVGTNLAAVFEQLNRDRQEQPLAAVFLLTDVAHNSGESDPRQVAATLNDTPVYVIPVGNTRHVRDIDLQSVFAPSVAMRNDDVVIEARVQAYDCEGEICVVQLLQDGQVIDFREVVLDSGFARRSVRFEQHLPAVGNQKFQIAVVPLEGESTEENNYGEVDVNVTRADVKVLLADELPRWEYRYLSQLFRRDPKIECDELLFQPRMIATGRREETQTFPITVADWDQYDVILLGDLPPEHLPADVQESLIDFVKQRGGTLIMIAGHEAMPQQYVDHPLREILPVQTIDQAEWTTNGYSFRVTNEGRDHLALMIGETEEATRTAWDFVNRFSPLHEVSPWRKPLPTAHSLIAAVPRDSLDEEEAAKSSSFLCWQPVGKGKVIYLSGPDTYRLRFLRGDRLHYRFWGQLLRWTIATDLSSGTKFVRVRTDRSRYDSRDAVNISVRLTNSEGQPVDAEGLEVRLTSGEDERMVLLSRSEDQPGEYVAEVRSLSPGVYRVEPVGGVIAELQKDESFDEASASFTVQADLPTELVDTRCDRTLAQQIADVTGGQVLPPTAVSEIIELTNLEPIVAERVESRPLWLEWKYLWIVFGCLQTEWVIRKWKGLS